MISPARTTGYRLVLSARTLKMTVMLHPMPPPTTSLHDLQVAMDDFVRTRGWYAPGSTKPQQPRNLAASIALEASEVLECFQWDDAADASDVAAELADVILYAAQLANVIGIDLTDAVRGKLELNQRRFPGSSESRWPSPAS